MKTRNGNKAENNGKQKYHKRISYGIFWDLYKMNGRYVKKKIITAVLFISLVYVYILIFHLSADDAEESSALSVKVMNWLLDIWYKLKGESGDGAVLIQNAVPLEKMIRKAAHFTEYMAVGFLSFSLAILWVRRMGYCIGIIAVQLLLSGILDEIHQYFVPGRYASVKDVLLDFAGGVTGVIIVLLFMWCKHFYTVCKKERKN